MVLEPLAGQMEWRGLPEDEEIISESFLASSAPGQTMGSSETQGEG